MGNTMEHLNQWPTEARLGRRIAALADDLIDEIMGRAYSFEPATVEDLSTLLLGGRWREDPGLADLIGRCSLMVEDQRQGHTIAELHSKIAELEKTIAKHEIMKDRLNTELDSYRKGNIEYSNRSHASNAEIIRLSARNGELAEGWAKAEADAVLLANSLFNIGGMLGGSIGEALSDEAREVMDGRRTIGVEEPDLGKAESDGTD